MEEQMTWDMCYPQLIPNTYPVCYCKVKPSYRREAINIRRQNISKWNQFLKGQGIYLMCLAPAWTHRERSQKQFFIRQPFLPPIGVSITKCWLQKFARTTRLIKASLWTKEKGLGLTGSCEECLSLLSISQSPALSMHSRISFAGWVG